MNKISEAYQRPIKANWILSPIVGDFLHTKFHVLASNRGRLQNARGTFRFVVRLLTKALWATHTSLFQGTPPQVNKKHSQFVDKSRIEREGEKEPGNEKSELQLTNCVCRLTCALKL